LAVTGARVRAEQVEMKLAPLPEVRRVEGMEQAVNLRLIRETLKPEELSQSWLVITERVIDLDSVVAANDKWGPESFEFIKPGVVDLLHLEGNGLRDGVKEAEV
jgi:hypothetical protein